MPEDNKLAPSGLEELDAQQSGRARSSKVGKQDSTVVIECLEDRVLYSADVLSLIMASPETNLSSDQSLASVTDQNNQITGLALQGVLPVDDNETLSIDSDALTSLPIATALTEADIFSDIDANFDIELGLALGPLDDSAEDSDSSFSAPAAILNDPVTPTGPTGLSSGFTLNTDGGNDTYLRADDGGVLLGDLDEFTVEGNYSLDTDNRFSTLISYANGDGQDTLKILIREDGSVIVGVLGDIFRSELVPQLLDGERHSVAVSWESSQGLVKIYVDGDLVDYQYDVSAGETLTAGGTLILGMEQDAITGQFEPKEVLSGTLYDFRLWNEVRTAKEIANNHSNKLHNDDLPAGLIANWQMDGLDGAGQLSDIVSNNNLQVLHTGEPGFSPSEPQAELRLAEGAPNGTVVGTLVTSSAFRGEDLIRDGSFTASGDTTIQTYRAGETIGDAWLVDYGNVELKTEWESSPSGGISVDLNGNTSGSISQTVSVEAGKTYVLNYAISGNFTLGDQKDYRLDVDGVSRIDSIVKPDGWRTGNLLWSQHSVTFTASSNDIDIRFSSATTGNRGPVISDVHLVEVDDTVASVLSSYPELTYDAATEKFYQPIALLTDWETARSNAVAMEVNGVSGRLVTIQNEDENSLVQDFAIGLGHNVFLGLTDQSTEGEWHWHTGSGDGELVWSDSAGGTVPDGVYTNWKSDEPNNFDGVEDHAVIGRFSGDGEWNDIRFSSVYSSVVEWESDDVTDKFSYHLQLDPAGALAINPDSGVLTVVDGSAIDFEAGPTYDIVVRVTDAAGVYHDQFFAIPIDNDSTPELIGLEAAAVTYNENDGPVSITDNLAVSDGDSVNLQSAVVSLSGNVGVDDVLALTATGNFTSSYNTATGELTIFGDESIGEWESALRSVTYENISDDPLPGQRTVEFVVNDGVEFSEPVIRHIDLIPFNDQPALLDGTFPDIYENTSSPVALTINQIFAGRFSDVDGVFGGIAVADNAATTEGNWQHSVDGGSTWSNIGAVTLSTATMLDTNALLRFLPVSDYRGAVPALTVYGVDDSYISGYTSVVNKVVADVSLRSALSPYSADSAIIQPTIVSVGPEDLSFGVQLNHDGGNDAFLQASDGSALLGGLTAFTIESQFSMSAPPAGGFSPLFSYSSTGLGNAVLVAVNDIGTVFITIDGERVEVIEQYPQLSDEGRHSIAVTWDSRFGDIAVYIDGDLAHSQSGVKAGHSVAPGGVLVIGQDQDYVGGGFKTDQFFSGSYYDLRVWSEVRSEAEIAGAYHVKLDPGALPAALIANWQMDEFNASGQFEDVVASSKLEVAHATVPGFVSSTPDARLTVFEGAADGTEVGRLIPGVNPLVEDLILDGRFTMDEGTSLTTYTAGDVLGGIDGHWQVISGDVAVQGHWGQSPLGGNAVNLDGTTPGAISQTFSTVPGKTYVVNFAMTGDFSKAFSKSMTVSAGGSSETFVVDVPAGWETDNLLWNHRSMTFTANSIDTTLTFAADSSASIDAPVIGDVQVVEVPVGVSHLLSADPDLHYDAGTGKFYKLVSTPQTWSEANNSAFATTLNGVPGQLARIYSAYENTVVHDLSQSATGSVWLGAGGVINEERWHWLDGREPGLQFWDGDETGVATNGAYTNWRIGEPDDNLGERYAILNQLSGLWTDRHHTAELGSVIEWDADSVLGAFRYSIESDPGGAFIMDADTGTLLVSDGSLLDYEASSTHDVLVRVTDIAGEFYEELVTIYVLNVNEAPVISTTGTSTLDYFESSGDVVVNNTLILADPDTATLTSATVVISGGYRASEDQLDFTGTSEISGSWDVGTGTLLLNGEDTVAAWQSVLRSVTYSNSSDQPESSLRTIDFVVSDGTEVSNTLSQSVAITEVNDAPIILDGILPDVMEDTTDPAGETVENTFSGQFSDVDGVVESIAIAADATTTEGEWQYSTDAGVNWYAINAIDETEALVINISDKIRFLPATDYHGAVPALTVYAVDDSSDGFATMGTLRVVTDVTVRGNDTPYSANSAAITGNVNAVFDPPVNLGIVPSATTTFEDIETVISLGGIAIDARDHTGPLTLKLTSLNGQLSWVDDPDLSFSSTGSQLEIVGDAASINDYLSGDVISYLHDLPHMHGSGADTVSVSLDYGGVSSALGDISIFISPINDAPQTQAAVEVSVDEDIPQVIPLSAFDFTDIHDNNNFLQVKVVNIPQFGVLTNDGSAVTNGASITVSDITANKLVYTPFVNANGLAYDQFTFRVQDDGGTADGGIDLSIDTGDVIFNVAPVNDLPALSVNPVDAIRGETLVLGASHIAPYEPDVDSTQRWITVSAVPINGALQVGGLTLVDGDRFSHDQLVTGLVRYIHQDVNAESDSIGLVLHDQGNDATSASVAVTLSINVQETHPHATLDMASVNEGQSITIEVLANDVVADAPLNAGSVLVTSQPLHGTVFVDANGAITYLHHGDETTSDSFAYTVSDTGGDMSLSGDVLLSIVPVNDDPEIQTPADAGSYLHRSPPLLVASEIELEDPDDHMLSSATVSIGAYEAGVESLALGAGSSLAYTWDAINGVLTIDGIAGLSDYQDALRSLSYQSEDTPSVSALTRTLSITVTDTSGASSDSAEFQLLLTVPERPIVFSAVNPDALVYVEDAPPLPIDSNHILDSLDSRDITSAQWQISGNYAADQDELLFNNTSEITGNWDAISGTLLLSGVADAATYQSALQSVAYVNSSQTPEVSPRTLSLVVESSSGQSDILQHSLQLVAVNDPPTAQGGAVSLQADNLYGFNSTDFGIADHNEGHELKAIVIESLPASGQLLFGYSPVSVGQEISRADLVAGELTYTPALNIGENPVSDLFTYRVRDDGGVDNGGIDLSIDAGLIQLTVAPVKPATDPAPEPFQVTENATAGQIVGQLDISTIDPVFTHLDNGTFTLADHSQPDLNRYAANGDYQGADLGSWQVTAGSVDLHGDFWQRGPGEGLALGLNGSEAGVIEQQFVTDVGSRYDITFMVSGDFRSDSNTPAVSLEVSAGDQTEVIHFDDFSEWSEQNLQWREETLTFTATTPVTALRFQSLTAGASGPLISDVQVRDELSFDNRSTQSPFTVDNSGTIYVADSVIDFETQNNHLLEIALSAQNGNEQILSVPIDVIEKNEKPILEIQQSVQMFKGTSTILNASHLRAIDVDVSDQSADSIFYVVDQTTSAGQLLLNGNTAINTGDSFTQDDLNSGRLSYINNSASAETDQFTFTLKDGGEDEAGTTAGEFLIEVYEPLTLAGSDTWSIPEQGVLTLTPTLLTTMGGFTQNDELLIEVTRPSQTTSFIDTRGETTVNEFTVSDVMSGSIQLHHDGSLPEPDSLQLSLFRTDINSSTAVDTRTLDLNVVDIANAPSANDSLMFTDHLTPLTITVAQIGFSDASDGDVLQALRLVEVPASGSLSLDGVVAGAGSVVPVSALTEGLLRYQPDSSVAGTITDHISFTVIDSGDVDTGGRVESLQVNSITITVVSNHSVVAHPDTITVPEGGAVSILSSGESSVAANDSDPDTDVSTLNIELDTGPANGTLELNPDGSFLYTHDGTETNSDRFSYRIFDPDQSSHSSVGIVQIQVIPGNDIPQGGELDDLIAVAAEPLNFSLPENLFTDVDDEELTLTAKLANGSELPDWLKFDPSSGEFSGRPDADDAGALEIVVIATDASGAEVKSDFQIIIEPAMAQLLPDEPDEIPKLPVAPPPETPPDRSTVVQVGGDELIGDTESTVKDMEERSIAPDNQQATEPSKNEVVVSVVADSQKFNDVIKKHSQTKTAAIINAPIEVNDALLVKSAGEFFTDDDFLPEVQSLIRQLDNGRDEIRNADARERVVQSGAFSISAGMSIGYVLWLIRSGLLLSSVFAAMPAWRWIDPLPVLDHNDDDDDDDTDESLESMVIEKEKQPDLEVPGSESAEADPQKPTDIQSGEQEKQ